MPSPKIMPFRIDRKIVADIGYVDMGGGQGLLACVVIFGANMPGTAGNGMCKIVTPKHALRLAAWLIEASEHVALNIKTPPAGQ